MKTGILSIAATLVLAGALRAQQTQVIADNQQIKIEITTYPETCSILTTGHQRANEHYTNNTCTELAITNKSTSPITAWAAVTYWYRGGSGQKTVGAGVRAEDSIFDPRNRVHPMILPLDTHRVIIGNPGRVEFKAAIFQDGATFGDAAWIKKIVENRRQHYQDVAVAIQKLRAGLADQAEAAKLQQELQALDRQEKMEQSANRPNPHDPLAFPLGGIGVFSTVAMNLGPQPSHERVESVLSTMLDLASNLLTSRPPIADHIPSLGQPLDAEASEGAHLSAAAHHNQ